MVSEIDTDRLKCNADRFFTWTSESNVGWDCMSVSLPPFTEDGKMRAVDRGVFNIAGCALFLVLYLILPESGRSMIGIIVHLRRSVSISDTIGFSQTEHQIPGINP